LLNDPTFVESARKFAERILAEGGDSDRARLRRAFLLALSRAPDAFEAETLLAQLAESRRHYGERQADATKLIQVGQSPMSTRPTVEQAAWTAVARVLLNLSETITRN